MISVKNCGVLLVLLLVLKSFSHYGQEPGMVMPIKPLRIDSQYIKSYRYQLTTRFFGSQKYTTISIPIMDPGQKYIHFLSNNTFNLGIGATYRGFTLNLGYGVPGINGDNSERGKTNKLDLQMHLHNRSSMIDVSGQFYRGFYNYKENDFLKQYAYDENLKFTLLGISYNYIFNNKKYTLRPGFHHDERQLRSAGSFLIGLQALYGVLENKSNIILPVEIMYTSNNMYRYRFMNAGPTMGYGYNWVLFKYLFLSVTANVGLQLSFIKENYDTIGNKMVKAEGLLPQYQGRVAIGYQNDQWGIIGSWVHLHQYSTATQIDVKYANTLGNARINFIYRFPVGNKLKRLLKPMEWIYK